MSTKSCSQCATAKPKSGFRKTQWKKPAAVMRCLACVAAGLAPAPAQTGITNIGRNNQRDVGDGPSDESGATSELSEVLKRLPFITIFVSGACLPDELPRWPGWMAVFPKSGR